jgi:tRNA dimethylallyltransferase
MKILDPESVFQKIELFLGSNPTGVIEILGATASGKTRLSIVIAQKFGPAEVISVDSRQVFRGCDVGSAKITKEEMEGVPHYGLDLVDLNQHYSVYEFQQYAFQCIEDMQNRKVHPILCGGTMLWLDAVSENYVFAKEKTEKSMDKGVPRWPVLKIGLHWEREFLYDRINRRAQIHFESGLIEETKTIFTNYHEELSQSVLTSIGYQEVKDYLDDEISYEQALEANRKRNRNYAKRQITWWRGREDVIWVDAKQL